MIGGLESYFCNRNTVAWSIYIAIIADIQDITIRRQKVLEDWKIKISVLWLFASVAFLAHQILVLMEPGIIAQLMAGEAEGQKIGPELILFFAISMLVPLVMAFLSLTLKDSMNRWVNIILGTVFAALWFVGVVSAALSAYWGEALMTLSAVAASTLIVWYAWKSKQKA
ncbi:MAG: DUF6326 family protein [Methanothrix sp.]|nr:DUF6326 family protein [Methanothrix sp.]